MRLGGTVYGWVQVAAVLAGVVIVYVIYRKLAGVVEVAGAAVGHIVDGAAAVAEADPTGAHKGEEPEAGPLFYGP